MRATTSAGDGDLPAPGTAAVLDAAAPDAAVLDATVLDEVAAATGLQEGELGVRQVLRAIHQLDPASTRAVSQHTGLPVPLVAAVSNELRARGLVTAQRPSQLTPRGLDLLGGAAPEVPVDACPRCDGHGVTIPGALVPVVEQLAALMARAPAVDLSLDQAFCTAETKVRRVLLLLRHGLLPATSLLVVGDDDLMAVAVAAVGVALGRPLVGRLAVVEISTGILDLIRDGLAERGITGEQGITAELVAQDLRDPLPAALTAGFELAMTDPPYTPEGARLFLARAAQALRPGPGRAIAFSYGPKGPEDAWQVQRTVTGLGLVVQSTHRGFNEYLGAGVIAGRSHLHWLGTTAQTATLASELAERYAGPMYTADKRAADRFYQCQQCHRRHRVGPGAQWRTISELKQAGCPACGGQRLRPLQLVRTGGTGR